ncbi:uncharacterized protein LOC114313423 [Camellia sinensis]|uniref:uncharacterized protein LOC114313423 n=1 Tax=Camellia sinensis TaxID=4442 RepID=UPI001035D748|nr:uncharacterized protein LOC114313423 [Camellia sinensis]
MNERGRLFPFATRLNFTNTQVSSPSPCLMFLKRSPISFSSSQLRTTIKVAHSNLSSEIKNLLKFLSCFAAVTECFLLLLYVTAAASCCLFWEANHLSELGSPLGALGLFIAVCKACTSRLGYETFNINDSIE